MLAALATIRAEIDARPHDRDVGGDDPAGDEEALQVVTQLAGVLVALVHVARQREVALADAVGHRHGDAAQFVGQPAEAAHQRGELGVALGLANGALIAFAKLQALMSGAPNTAFT